jgi:hypothetical protein
MGRGGRRGGSRAISYAEEEAAMIERRQNLIGERWSEPDDDGGARWMDFGYGTNIVGIIPRYCPSAESGQRQSRVQP